MLTADDFRALARSGPFLHAGADFTLRTGAGEVEVMLRRPVLRHRSRGSAVWHRTTGPAHDPADLAAVVRRADGLVTARPTGHTFDDAMVDNYFFVALLDPAELAAGVELHDLREVVRGGRTSWAARCVVADEGDESAYDPLCACCPLLWSSVSDRWEADDVDDPSAYSSVGYPEAYDVVLDRESAMVVSLQPVWGRTPPERVRPLWAEVDLRAVIKP